MHQGIKAEKPLIMNTEPNLPLVKDIALRIHRSFYDSFEYATIIREGTHQKKKKVGLDYEMRDNDVIEIHTK